jgi:hypothetical protein
VCVSVCECVSVRELPKFIRVTAWVFVSCYSLREVVLRVISRVIIHIYIYFSGVDSGVAVWNVCIKRKLSVTIES